MASQRALRPILICLVSCFLIGCSSRVKYAVANSGGQKLTDVGVFINEDHGFTHGSLGSGIESGFGGAIRVFPENKVRIIWNDSDSTEHTVELTVSGDDLRDPRSIMFVIDDDMQVTTQWRFDR